MYRSGPKTVSLPLNFILCMQSFMSDLTVPRIDLYLGLTYSVHRVSSCLPSIHALIISNDSNTNDGDDDDGGGDIVHPLIKTWKHGNGPVAYIFTTPYITALMATFYYMILAQTFVTGDVNVCHLTTLPWQCWKSKIQVGTNVETLTSECTILHVLLPLNSRRVYNLRFAVLNSDDDDDNDDGITAPSDVVETKLGVIEGHTVQSPQGVEVMEFLGIPFAEPPLGELRYADPVAIQSLPSGWWKLYARTTSWKASTWPPSKPASYVGLIHFR